MEYSKNFKKALATGQVVVRRVFENTNKPEQVTVQFMQQVKRPLEGNSILVAAAQGLGTSNLVTALFSFKRDVLAAAGVEVGDYFDGEKVILGMDLFPEMEEDILNIHVVENFEMNPFVKKQEVRLNPSTGVPLEFFGKNFYRHTELVAGNPENLFMNQERAKELLGLEANAEEAKSTFAESTIEKVVEKQTA